MKRQTTTAGFTIVELLVVIAIMAVLMSIILPALSKAKRKGWRIQSISNLKQIGVAFEMYVHDHRDNYPLVRGVAAVGGNRGDLSNHVRGIMPNEAQILALGVNTPPEERPLNEYIKNTKIFHDPADNGGTGFGFDEIFTAFGNSYQAAVGNDFFRVKRVLGDSAEDPLVYEGKSMRRTDLTDPSNKIILGDWNWPFDEADSWHAHKGEAGHVMLFADGHAEYFVFPPSDIMMKWLEPPYKLSGDGDKLLDPKGEYDIDQEKFRADSPARYRTIGQGENERDATYVDAGFEWW